MILTRCTRCQCRNMHKHQRISADEYTRGNIIIRRALHSVWFEFYLGNNRSEFSCHLSVIFWQTTKFSLTGIMSKIAFISKHSRCTALTSTVILCLSIVRGSLFGIFVVVIVFSSQQACYILCFYLHARYFESRNNVLNLIKYYVNWQCERKRIALHAFRAIYVPKTMHEISSNKWNMFTHVLSGSDGKSEASFCMKCVY